MSMILITLYTKYLPGARLWQNYGNWSSSWNRVTFFSLNILCRLTADNWCKTAIKQLSISWYVCRVNNLSVEPVRSFSGMSNVSVKGLMLKKRCFAMSQLHTNAEDTLFLPISQAECCAELDAAAVIMYRRTWPFLSCFANRSIIHEGSAILDIGYH